MFRRVRSMEWITLPVLSEKAHIYHYTKRTTLSGIKPDQYDAVDVTGVRNSFQWDPIVSIKLAS